MSDPRRDPLRDAIERWREETDSPPPALRARVRDAIEAEAGADRAPRHRRGPGPLVMARRHPWPAGLAAAATLLLAMAGVWWSPRTPDVESATGQLVVADALAAARRAEREHAEAIARLQDAASVVLARAGGPDTPVAETMRLIAYRERLAAIDAAIQSIESYLKENPGLGGARTLLLASYVAKTDLLREILALKDPEGA